MTHHIVLKCSISERDGAMVVVKEMLVGAAGDMVTLDSCGEGDGV